MDPGCDRLDPNNGDRFPNYQTHNTPTTSDRAEFPEIGREIWKHLEKGWEVLQFSPRDRDKIYYVTMFLQRREQLERRARTGQLLPRDLKLIEQIERTSAELQKLAQDLKKLNNNKQ